jgi:hypothetical protein
MSKPQPTPPSRSSLSPAAALALYFLATPRERREAVIELVGKEQGSALLNGLSLNGHEVTPRRPGPERP